MRKRNFCGAHKSVKTKIDKTCREDLIIDVVCDILASDFDNDPTYNPTAEDFMETRKNFTELLDIRKEYKAEMQEKRL